MTWDAPFGGSNLQILFARSTDNGKTFSTPIALSSITESFTDLGIAGYGSNVYAVWDDDTHTPGVPDIYFAKSNNNGSSFGNPINISNNAGTSLVPQIVVSAVGNIYITWQDDTPNPGSESDVFFSSSTNGGTSFSNPVIVGTSGGSAQTPKIVTSGKSSVYLVWNDFSGNSDVFFAKSNNNGSLFGSPVNISNNPSTSTLPQLAVSLGGTIYVSWVDYAVGNGDIFVSKSTDGGQTFQSAIDISNNPIMATNPRVSVSDNNHIYTVWEGDPGSGANDIYFSYSSNNGTTFSNPVDISNNPGYSTLPVLASFGNSSFVAWQDSTSGNPQIFFRTIQETGPASISIESINNSDPLWGLDQVAVSGVVNANTTDSINLDWGDGQSSSLSISGTAWGPVSHTYSSQHVGANLITATLKDANGTIIATSSSHTINVQKHSTALTLNSIGSVIQSSSIVVSGSLTDVSTNPPAQLQNKQITFNGTGAAGLAPVFTMANGSYAGSGVSPNLAADLLEVQAHFEGDGQYLGANSTISTYDTVANGAANFNVPAGTPSHVNLVGFGGSIDFDKVQNGGKVFVSSCNSPASPRYTTANECIEISPTFDVSQGYAHIHLSFNNLTLPQGYTSNDVDIFHDDLSGIVDITESRNLTSEVVTGRTMGFSKFIVAPAIHSAILSGAARQQLFVGNDTLLFNFNETRQISLDQTSYSIGSTPVITVVDPNAGSSSVHEISATVSSSSDPQGIIVPLNETSPNSNTFTGSFTLVSGASSSHNKMLHVQSGDSLKASYNAVNMAPLSVVISGVSEAGLLEVSNYTAPSGLFPIGDGHNVSLVDAALTSNANITITMSYANVLSTNFDPDAMSMLLMKGSICENDITLRNSTGYPIGLDKAAKTLTGETHKLGQFTLAFAPISGPGGNCPGSGGGGGGLSRPGAGIVLDSVASIIAEQSGGVCMSGCFAGSSGGSSGSAPTQPPSPSNPLPPAPSISSPRIPSGTGVEINVTIPNTGSTQSGPVNQLGGAGSPPNSNVQPGPQNPSSPQVSLVFEKVTSGGLVTVKEYSPLQLANLFSSENTVSGTVDLHNNIYSTAGTLIDISPITNVSPSLNFTGTVDVTIPYNLTLVHSLSTGGKNFTESDTRFLHYNGSAWEDATIYVNTTAKTVTGRVSSLSPMVAAVVNDGTYGSEYFDLHPLSKVMVVVNSTTSQQNATSAVTNPVLLPAPSGSTAEVRAGQQVTIGFMLKNQQQAKQPYTAIIEVLDQNGYTSNVNIIGGTLDTGQTIPVNSTWVAQDPGQYTVKVVIVSSLSSDTQLLSGLSTGILDVH